MKQKISKSRLAKQVKIIINKEDKIDLGYPEFQDLIDSTRPLEFRICWALIVVSCFLLACFQISNRVQYFLTYPVSVDVKQNEIEHSKTPEIILCSMYNDQVNHIINNIKSAFRCLLPFVEILGQYENFNFEKLWEFKNESLIYLTHEFLPPKHFQNNIVKGLDKNTFGQCTRFQTEPMPLSVELIIKIKKSGLHCEPNYSFISLKSNYIDFRDIFIGISGYSVQIKAVMKRYQLLNTPNKKCTKDEIFIKCLHDCLIRRFVTETNCRLPFFPDSVKHHPCNSSNVLKTLQKTRILTAVLDPYGECKCIRLCNQISYIYNPTIILLPINDTELRFSIDRKETVYTESSAYDLISLLADVGGNLSLFLGLSILSIVDISLNAVTGLKIYISRKSKKNEVFNGILKKHREFILKEKKLQLSGKNQNRNVFKSCYLIVTFFVCLAMAVFIIYYRIQYYKSYPTRFTVELEPLTRLQFPTLTLCGLSARLASYNTLYKKVKQGNINTCKIDIIDMLKFKSTWSFEFLWKSALPAVIDTRRFIKTKMGFDTLHPNISLIHTHLGTCRQFIFSEDKYTGLFTIFFLGLSGYKERCPEIPKQIFLGTSGTQSYDILSRNELPVNTLLIFDYTFSTIKRLSSAAHPCLEKQIFNKCKQNCFDKEIRETKLCNLPFMKNNAESCSSISDAKKSRQAYVNMLANFSKSCPCIHPCEDTLMSYRSYSQTFTNISLYGVVSVMTNNMVEHIIEIERYSLHALFSDVGNAVGLALGLSVLTIARSFRLAYSYISARLQQSF